MINIVDSKSLENQDIDTIGVMNVTDWIRIVTLTLEYDKGLICILLHLLVLFTLKGP